MKSKKNTGIDAITKMIVDMAREGLKNLPAQEQERRLKLCVLYCRGPSATDTTGLGRRK